MAITTGKVRASYVHIFQPRASDNGGDPKYSVTLLIPKTDISTINKVYAEIERAKQEGAQKVFNGNIPPQCKTPLYDGDGYRPSGEAFGEECKGCMVITASDTQQPVVVGLDMQAILDPADLYSGCYIRANINFYAYNRNGSKGIGCGLKAVQKIADGEPLARRISAEEAFGGANSYQALQGYGGYQAPQGNQQGYGGYQAPQGNQQGYGGYQAPQGNQQGYGGYQAPQDNQQGYGGYQAPQDNQQGYGGYQAPQGNQQGYGGYQAPQGNQQGYGQNQPPAGQQGYTIDPITGRPTMPGGVMGI